MTSSERRILSLDMSTTCTGFAVFGADTQVRYESGRMKPSTKGGVAKMEYPKQQLTKMIDLGNQILALIQRVDPVKIVIEEIAGSKNRMGQKTLDGLHFVVAWIIEEYLDRVAYYDVSGAVGWRTHLQLRLSEADKLGNKEAKKLNKKLPAAQRLPVIGPKHLACRYVNSQFGTTLDVEKAETDGDEADALALGHAYLKFRFPKERGTGIV